jgi:hypothetical protein
MSNEFCTGFENAPVATINDLNLLEVMDICSNLYLTHLLAVEILGYQSEEGFTELGESPWVSSILFFIEHIFFKLKRIH